MGHSASPPKLQHVANHPQRAKRHDLQQQAGVTRQRDAHGQHGERDRLRQSQADAQSDAI